MSGTGQKVCGVVVVVVETEENLRIICEESMSENRFLQVLQALNSLNIFQALEVFRFYMTGWAVCKAVCWTLGNVETKLCVLIK